MQLQSRGSLEPSPTPLAANLLDRVHLFSTLLVQFVCARTGLLLTFAGQFDCLAGVEIREWAF